MTVTEPGQEVVHAERTALKEWAVLVDAMARGEFCAMIRKGGIREQRAGFAVRHDRFLLYPTFFHEKTDELAPTLRLHLAEAHDIRPPGGNIVISHAAKVSAVWRVTNLEALRATDGEHGLAWEAVESRFYYRNNPGVHVVALELSSLPTPVVIPETRRYLGCVSWVELDAPVSLSGATPVHNRDEVECRLSRLRAALGEPLRGEGGT